MIKHAGFILMAMLLISGASFAGSDYNAHFGDMDKDGNQIVVKDEFAAYFKDNSKPDEAFAIIDADSSGGIDHDEWHAFKKMHGYEHMDGKTHMGGPGHMEGMKHMEGVKQ